MDWTLLVEEYFLILANYETSFPLCVKKKIVFRFFRVLRSLITSLLCIMGELAGESFVALALGLSDR